MPPPDRRTPEEEAEELALRLTSANPYQGRPNRPLALGLAPHFQEPRGGSHAHEYLGFADHMLRMLWDALAFWTPTRIEEAALARAGDITAPSLLAQEVAIFSAQYFKRWLPALHDWARHDNSVPVLAQYGRALFLRDLLQEAIQALERRASSLEARALDLRLRFDLGHIRALLAREELATAVISAVSQAVKEDGEARLAAIRSELDAAAGRLEPKLGDVADAVEFIFERSVKAWGQELTSGGPARAMAGALASAVRSSVLSLVFKKLTGL